MNLLTVSFRVRVGASSAARALQRSASQAPRALRGHVSAASAVVALLAAFGVFATGTLAHARSTWLLPSSTVLTASDKWVTVDAGASSAPFENSVFPLGLDSLRITAPDGSAVAPQNALTGALRSVFDVPLAQHGTYRLAALEDNAYGIWKDAASGEERRWRGPAEQFAKAVPADARELQSGKMLHRTEVFVTVGAPGPVPAESPQYAGKGLELVPFTHPNDLVPDEEAEFGFLLNGEPVPNLRVTVTPGGFRWRDDLGERILKTDGQGRMRITWPAAGQYLLYARVGELAGEEIPADAPKLPANSPYQFFFYAGTFEVLP